jgi:cytochrome P450
MSSYAAVLMNEDPRIPQIFNVESETLRAGGRLIEDPFPGLNRLREQAAVQKGSVGELLGYQLDDGFHFHQPDLLTYSAFSFAAVSRALIENTTFSSQGYEITRERAVGKGTILQKVGADHRRYRDPIQPLFSPEAAETWWNDKIIAETVETLISTIEVKREADLFVELCARMPVHVVSAGFGIDPDEIIPFRMALIGATEGDPQARDPEGGRDRAHAILRRVIEARRTKPENDIISRLVQAEITLDDGVTRPFTTEEIIDHCRLILVAGGGTTWRQLGITLFALLNNPDQLEALKADRGLLPRTILESARWHATDLIFPRRVEQDVTLEGVDIPKGALLHMCLGSANRDPDRWENPDAFDIFRPLQRAVAFGGGPHSCLGQHVSRQEMVVALNAVMDRLPNLRWDPSKAPPRLVGGLFQRGPSGLPVVFG